MGHSAVADIEQVRKAIENDRTASDSIEQQGRDAVVFIGRAISTTKKLKTQLKTQSH
jgi:hypothetical protein